ncbi:MAG: S8 family serine peptidase [Anaerolineae bacterium]|jgi:subtilisin family serine protease
MKAVVRLFVLVVVVLVLTSALPLSLADRADRVLIEVVPGQLARVARAARGMGGQIHYEFAELNTLAVTLPSSGIERMRRNPNVVAMEADPYRYPAGDLMAGQVIPYGIGYVQAPAVWDAGYLGQGVTVCIIDTGLNPYHEDLAGLPNIDGYSQVDDRWDFDGYGHGTHVAGTITAISNTVGVVGVSPGMVSLYIVKIFDNDGEWVPKARASDLMAAAQICADNGAQIISMSLGGSSKARPEQLTFERLYGEGILPVAAAGNGGNDHLSYPASYDSVVSVAAIDESYTVADFSQYNEQVELAAPGVNVLSTVPFVSVAGVTVEGVFYEGLNLEYAPYTPVGGVSGVLADGGLCDASGSWAGMVVLCERGDINFVDKVENVMDGGGVAAVIYNNAPGGFSGTLGDEGDYIPAVSISQEDGQFLVAQKLGLPGTVESYPPEVGSGYEAWGGTSMATPHVSGVAALLWSYDPSLTNVQIREAMAMTAMDLGEPGWDVHYGYGLVQAFDALQYLENLPPGQGPKGPRH